MPDSALNTGPEPGAGTAATLGLTGDEVERRRRAGLGNEVEQRTGRSVTDILRANVLTRFNAIITSLALVVLIFGQPIDAVFGLVMVLNSAIGIIQELRAKRSLDALQVLLVPAVTVMRDGASVSVEPEWLVLGDVIELQAGDQVPVDGKILRSNGLETDESPLTGESQPVPKPVGSEVMSGSFVVAGTAIVEATAVGADSWAAKLTAEAKDYVLTRSELRMGIDHLLRAVSWLLPPLSALLLWSQLQAEASTADGLVSAVAGVVALVPQGLVLLISMTFAIAVIRLAANQVVVQELPAVEGLARVDVLCVDKTGTLTTGRLSIDRIISVGPRWGDKEADAELRSGLLALAAADAARSATTEAIEVGLTPLDDQHPVDGDTATARVPLGPSWEADDIVPFSSVRKWSGITFAGHGTWILGAPEVLLDAIDRDYADIRQSVDRMASSGRRVLLAARTSSALTGEELPSGLEPTGLVSLKEEVRPDAAETVAFFRDQQVEIKVLSGDNPKTVASVAAELGIEGADEHVDMRKVGEVGDPPPNTTVFGRVRPEQKRDIVRLLQAQGHTVAMTGDGVNDIPSLKAADLGIAMNTATAATKAVSQLVLLDGRFATLPGVVGEGRRVIANMERVSCLFVTKTVYATILAVAVGVLGIAFPFLPRHLSLIGALTIGIPGFVLSFLPSNEPCRPGYLRRVLRFSIPAGVVVAVATLSTFLVSRSSLIDVDLGQARTAATMAMTLAGLWILFRLTRPLDRIKAILLSALFGLLVLALIPAPWSEIYALELPPLRATVTMVAALTGVMAGLELIDRFRPNGLRRQPADHR